MIYINETGSVAARTGTPRHIEGRAPIRGRASNLLRKSGAAVGTAVPVRLCVVGLAGEAGGCARLVVAVASRGYPSQDGIPPGPSDELRVQEYSSPHTANRPR